NHTYIFAIGIGLFGVYVFTRGSFNWYEQTQKYQDAIVKHEARKAQVAKTWWFTRELLVFLVFAAIVGFAWLIYLRFRE
ncbi:MAG: hypothetical protein ACTHK7_22735, partial [Aureliella sp.]